MVRRASVGLGFVVLAAMVGLGCGAPAGGGQDGGAPDASANAGGGDAGAGDAGVVDGGSSDGGTSDGGTGGCMGTSTTVVSPGTATTTTATIGFAGGTLTLDGATVTIPPGALAADTALTFTHEAAGPATGYADTGRRWSLAPAGVALARPVTVTLPYPGDLTTAAGYWSAPGGTGYERIGADAGSGQVSLRIVRFGSGFAASSQCHDTLTAYAVVSRPRHLASGDSINLTDLSQTGGTIYVPNATGGLDAYPTTGDAHGLLRATGVPPSPVYYMEYWNPSDRFAEDYPEVVVTPTATLDASAPNDERLDIPIAGQGTSVAVTVTGLTPWKVGDDLSLVGLNCLPPPNLTATPTGGGSTTASVWGDWKGEPLIDTTKGDRLVVLHGRLSTLSDGTTVRAILDVAAVPDLTVVDGQRTQVTVTATPLGATAAGSLSVSVDRDAYAAALAAAAPPGTTALGAMGVGLNLFPAPDPLPFGIMGGWGVFLGVGLPTGTGPFTLAGIDYHDPFDPSLPLLGKVYADQGFGTVSSTGQRDLVATVSSSTQGPFADIFGPTLTPILGPIRAPQINGLDATSVLTGTGTTPEITWQPPAQGSPVDYFVYLYDMTAFKPVTMVWTSVPDFRVPPGLLTTGHNYIDRIEAEAGPARDPRAPNVSFDRHYQWAIYEPPSFTP